MRASIHFCLSAFAWAVCLSVPQSLRAGSVNFPLAEASLQSEPVLKVQPDGTFTAGEILFYCDYRKDKTGTYQYLQGAVAPDKGFPKIGEGSWLLEGRYHPKNDSAPLVFRESITRAEAGGVDFSAEISSTSGQPLESWRWVARLPVGFYDGRTIYIGEKPVLLQEAKDGVVVGSGRGGLIRIPGQGGDYHIQGALRALVLDSRAFDQQHFSLIMESTSDADPANRAIRASVEFVPHTFKPVDLASVANMGFADASPNDGTGGWTDEGPEHDLSSFPSGRQVLGEVPFVIPESPQKGALVFAGPQRAGFLSEASLPVEGETFRTLFLLHAFAWDHEPGTLLGTLVATYKDGTVQKIPVEAHRDASNWGAAYDVPNGMVVWEGETRRGLIGLGLSRFTLKDKPLESLTIQGSGKAVWMIAGATGVLQEIGLPSRNRFQAYEVVEGKEWVPYPDGYETAPGSILDFSGMLDAPAGKHGRVVVKDGHFVFEDKPGKRVRFFGTNLVFDGNFVPKELAPKLAQRLAMLGYNAVRLHHFDGLLLEDPKRSSFVFNPEMLDRLDYLAACLKEVGLYLSIDLYSDRHFPAGEIEEIPASTRKGIKAAVTVSDSAFKVWQKFARAFLEHKNPYTGFTYAEEPAMIGICPINENVLQACWSNDATVGQLIRKNFEEWQTAKDGDKSGGYARFLTDLQIKSQKEVADFLRKETGVRALLTDVNHRDYLSLALVRENLDYVDIHRYWDHPRFVGTPWRLPFLFDGLSAIEKNAQTPRELFPARILGKPFMVTEFHFLYPNRYRGESGPLMGAYAAFQDWDGLFRFDYGGKPQAMTSPGPITGLNTFNDPVSLVADRLISLLFLREDVEQAKDWIVFQVDAQQIWFLENPEASFSPDFSELGLLTGLAVTTREKFEVPSGRLLAVIRPDEMPSPVGAPTFADTPGLGNLLTEKGILASNLLRDGVFLSDTGQIHLDSKRRTFAVITPKTEAFVNVNAGVQEGAFARVETFGPGVVSISAMDGKVLESSRRLLVFHLTDAQNSGILFRNTDRKIVEAWGGAPQLIEAGRARLGLKISGEARPVVWALDSAGNRVREIPVRNADGGIEIDLETVGPDGVTLAYEIAERDPQP